MMRIVASFVLCAAAALAQNGRSLGLPASKPIETNFKGTLDAVWKQPHFHTIPYNCKAKTNHVYAREGDVYFACLNGNDVCSKEKGVTIPFKLIEDFQELERQHAGRLEQGRIMRAKIEEDLQASRQRTIQPPAAPQTRVIRVSSSDLAPGTVHPPIADDRLQSLSVGAPRAEVLQKLGDPHMKMSGDVEYYTYLLVSGNSVQLELQDGKLTRTQLIRMK